MSLEDNLQLNRYLPPSVAQFLDRDPPQNAAESSLSQADIARRSRIPALHLTQMKQVNRRSPLEYDLRLSCLFGITPGMWVNHQLDNEFMRADREKGDAIRKEVQP